MIDAIPDPSQALCILSAIIGGAASAAASGISAGAGAASNSAEAKKQRQFQYYMDSSKMQRAVADAKRANLNPMLVAQFGGGSTPPGAQARHDFSNISGDISRGVSSAAQALQASKAADNLTATTNLVGEQIKTEKSRQNNIDEDTKLKRFQGYGKAGEFEKMMNWLGDRAVLYGEKAGNWFSSAFPHNPETDNSAKQKAREDRTPDNPGKTTKDQIDWILEPLEKDQWDAKRSR